MKKRRKKKYSFSKSPNILRYSILTTTIIVLLSGSLFLVNLLDPYSNFGRIMTNIARPVYILLNNALVKVLEYFHSYALYPVRLHLPNLWVLALPLAFFILLFFLSYFRGRLYCNSVCPVGALLSLFSRFSLFKIRFRSEKCNSCGLCTAACKAECIDFKNNKVDFSRCVACFDCLPSCPHKGISFSTKPEAIKADQPDKRRRYLLSSLIILPFLLSAKNDLDWKSKKSGKAVPVKKKHPVTPPGSQSLKRFTGKCTSCHLCVSVCPTQVIQPQILGYGLEGFFQPAMDYHVNYCNFECTLCTEICPTGALTPVTKDKKHILQLGKVHFLKENCVVFTDETACGSCSEHCPTQAVRMVPYKGNLKIPETNNDICVGCGACEYACPTLPFKAIFVEPNSVHLTAQKPKQIKSKEGFDPEKEFPF